MTPALEFTGVVKDYRGLRPLRLAEFTVEAGETFINLATGAGLPDSGDVRVMGQSTSAITDGDNWLVSLDRFGVVSHRAVLLEASTVAQNIAMSYTLSIDPIAAAVRGQVDAVARRVDLAADVMDRPLSAAGAAGKVRTHLARALALGPSILIFEHATLGVPREDVDALAASIARATGDAGLTLIAITDDDAFAKGLNARRLKLDAGTGKINGDGPHLFRWRW